MSESRLHPKTLEEIEYDCISGSVDETASMLRVGRSRGDMPIWG